MRNDYPRVPRELPGVETEVKAFIGCWLVSALLVFTFWAVVGYVVGHFVLKYW